MHGGELFENKPGNLGFALNSNNELFTDDDIREAIHEAKESVDQAINKTIKYVLEKSSVEFPLIDYKDQQFYSLEQTNQNEQNLNYVFSNRFNTKKPIEQYSPSKLIKIGRFPLNSNSIESAKSTEIYERAIELLKRKAEMRFKFETVNFTYTDLLTTNQLNILNTLTGCLHGNRHHNLLKYQNCDNNSKYNDCYRRIDGTCNNLKKPLSGAGKLNIF